VPAASAQSRPATELSTLDLCAADLWRLADHQRTWKVQLVTADLHLIALSGAGSIRER